MSERVRTDFSRGSLENGPSPEDVRRQLEGRVEVVEAARERYSRLESLLSERRWKRRLREQPGAIQEVLRHEPSLDEALSRIQRRAEVDGWPEELPVLVAVREVRSRRARLEAIVLKRLGSLTRVANAPSLVEALARLEGLVLQPLPLEPAEGEVRLLEGKPGVELLVLVGYFAFILGQFATDVMGLHGALVLLATVLLVLVFALSSRLRIGHYWLTSERLVWKPFRGELVQVPLRSIREGGVRLDAIGLGVHVDGERSLYIRDEQHARRLAALLEMRRQPPFLGLGASGRQVDAACYEATLREGPSVVKGHAVLGRDFVAFFPEGQGPEALRALTGAPSPPQRVPIEVPWLIEQLRFLPSEAAFDECVTRAATAVGGVRWSLAEARYRGGLPVWKEIRFTSGPRVLRGKVDWSQQSMAEWLLSGWPRR